MNRRSFLMCGGSVLSAQVSPSKRTVVGIIGAGSRGMQLLKTLLADVSARIGAVCETYEPRMFEAVALGRAQGHRTRYYRVYRDLLSDKSIDAVVIATPDFWHARMTIEALDAAKDVYVEQPLCRTWQEGVGLITAHSRSKQIVQVGCQRRSSPAFAELARRFRNGQAGFISRIDARADAPYLRRGVLKRGPTKLPEPLNFEDWQAGAEARAAYSPDRFLNWRFYPVYGGGCIACLGSSLVDGVHMVTGLGYPVSVIAHGVRSKEAGFDTFERARVQVEYTGGVVAKVEIDGTSRRSKDVALIEGDRHQIKVDAVGSGYATTVHVAGFLSSVRSRATPIASPNVVFPATLICQMANLSLRTGHKMYWKSAQFRVEG